MTMPGFTAEVSLHGSANFYRSACNLSPRSSGLVPQASCSENCLWEAFLVWSNCNASCDSATCSRLCLGDYDFAVAQCAGSCSHCSTGKPWCNCLQACATPGICNMCEKTSND
jgi:hypothetical protein